MLLSFVFLLPLQIPVQPPVAPPAPTEEVRPLPAAARFTLNHPELVHFEVPTTAGVLKGTMRLTRLDIRGLTTRAPFDLRGRIDVSSVSTGDAVADAHIARAVLDERSGDMVFGATKRITPEADGDARWGFGLFLDGARSGRYREIRYAVEPKGADSVRMTLTHTASADEWGLKAHAHPFIKVTGPVTIKLDATLDAVR